MSLINHAILVNCILSSCTVDAARKKRVKNGGQPPSSPIYEEINALPCDTEIASNYDDVLPGKHSMNTSYIVNEAYAATAHACSPVEYELASCPAYKETLV